jgi:hypothetical protein
VFVEQGLGDELGKGMLGRSAIVVLLSSIDLVVNRRVWGLAVAVVSMVGPHESRLHHFYRLNLRAAFCDLSHKSRLRV